MKKIDKLILKSFIGPFLITFFVVVFILLTQYMLKYFDDFVGKDLGFSVFAELIGYFSINMTPIAFPLAVLLSSLMTFGNLGEHFELTAIKSAGISLVRVLRPLFVFVVFLSALVYYSNNFIVPKANLEAFSLLYDIKQKKPSIDIKEGAFYGGIPGYSIKANKKFDDEKSLGDLIIYNHSDKKGNTEIILADSALMYTILGDKYLVMELFNGKSYTEEDAKKPNKPSNYVRNVFQHNKVVFSLASFEMERTDKDLFSSNRMMKNESELRNDVDSMHNDIIKAKRTIYRYTPRFFNMHLQEVEEIKPKTVVQWEEQKKDTISANSDSIAESEDHLTSADIEDGKNVKFDKANYKRKDSKNSNEQNQIAQQQDSVILNYDSALVAKADSVYAQRNRGNNNLVDKPRFAKNRLKGENRRIESREFESNVYGIEANAKLSQAVACIVMFLIGAPLGAIIKKGGLGFPVIVSILFFIVSYVINTTGIKLGRAGDISNFWAVWTSNLILLPFGLFFLRQARNDSRLFETDYYAVKIAKLFKIFKKEK
ncbi:lipopolysaccharide export system permease protein [Marivirga sericea]|uniref:Lipopolysaccharide export system permease protein n=1 Tax=Marivirga sericea TaxID=1028 RepID=A0A1X7ILC4_9BACT|nr:LptF/LptG family permease [Marivirga sericea]SMG15344.1 lipopolysaccharide export system permease protein [Marivirga sericea]